jgi:hypothetical protein
MVDAESSVFYSAAAENNVYHKNKQLPNVTKEIFPYERVTLGESYIMRSFITCTLLQA